MPRTALSITMMLGMTTLVRGAEPPDALIGQLGDAEFHIREEASKKLAAAPEAAPWVRRATRHADPEVANRAKTLAQGHVRRQLTAAKDVLLSNPQVIQPDLFLEWYLAWQPPRIEELWQPGFDLGLMLASTHAKLLPPKAETELARTRPRNLAQLRMSRSDPIRMLDGPEGRFDADLWLVRTTSLTKGPLLLVLGIVREVGQSERLYRSSLLTLDSARIGREAVQSVIVCHGDFQSRPETGFAYLSRIRESIIISRGNVVGSNGEIRSSVILGGRDVEIGPGCRLKDSTIIAGGKVTIPKSATVENCVIKENVKNPTAPFTFFEVADVSLALGTPAKDAKGLPVGDIKPDTPFGKAGVKKGDTILAIDDAPPGDAEAFRVKLRRAIVVQGDILLTVSRDGKTLDLPVYFPLPKPPEK